MPRNHAPAASTLRNRNRITNKTRLKIVQGSLEDAVLIPDEDEEKHRLTNLVAGVDAEDANEHHLQEVLSAAHRNNANNANKASRSADKPALPLPSAFIPTPDSTGVVANSDELYPFDKWKDPVTYVCTSQTVEEGIANGIANGFTYYMDERDKEWFDKNNEEARGEGTSAQGAVSASGTRTSARSAKAKGKEPEPTQPVVISEDEFELIMGIFEKVTHERTEYLHHGLETGMDFPAFTEYQDVFSSPLPISMFATFNCPTWLPAPASLQRTAKVIYPHWKERRMERGGHRIIPTLNGDEADTLNESYVCFRRRESKSVRKTRASQSSSSDKLARLQLEFNYPLELAKSILSRETTKKESAIQSQAVWEKRMAFADLKRKFPTLTDKIDEELLVDKERPSRRPEASRVPGLKIRTNETVPAPRQDPVIRPKDRVAMIRDQVEATLERQKLIDHHWEDVVDNPYRSPLLPYASKLFKYIPPSETPSPSWSSSGSDKTDDDSPPSTPPPTTRYSRAVRMRYGRGGRIHLDRRDSEPRKFLSQIRRSSLFALYEDAEMDVDETDGDVVVKSRLEEQWKFDLDDVPAVGPEGVDEQDRILVDDYDTTYLRHTMTLHNEADHVQLVTDPTVVIAGPDGRPQGILPYRLGMPPLVVRRDAQGVLRHYPAGLNGMQPVLPSQMHSMLGLPNGTPVSMHHQIKKMQPPAVAPQMRISSNGGMRPPSVPVSNLQQQQQAQQPQPNGIPSLIQHTSPHPVPAPAPQHPSANGINGTTRAAISMPHVDVQKSETTIPIISNGAVNGLANAISPPHATVEGALNGLPARPKSQNINPHQQQHGIGAPTNGFHPTSMNNSMSASAFQAAYQNAQSAGGLSLQQVQNLKSAFANIPASEMAAINGGRSHSGSYMMTNGTNVNMPLAPGTNMNLKLPATRHMQWAQMQRPPSVVNGLDVPMNGVMSNNLLGSPNLSHSIPVRSPSTNGTRPGLRNGVHVNGQHSMSPHHQHSPLPNIAHSQSPPRLPMTPNIGINSPSLQQQQAVGNQNGY